MLGDGFAVKKHGRLGGPKERLVRLEGDAIVWDSARSGRGVAVADIVDVRRAFSGRPRPPGVEADRCLSLVTRHRAVNLELPDNEVRELCVDGFGLLMRRPQLLAGREA